MTDGTPADAHPSYPHERAGEHSDGWCVLNELLAIDWSVTGDASGRSRREIFGQGGIDALQALESAIENAGLSTCEFRLLVSFDS